MYSIFRIVNETSTDASLVKGIDQLYSTNRWPGERKIDNVNNGPQVSREFACRSRTPALFLFPVFIYANIEKQLLIIMFYQSSSFFVKLE